MERHPRHVPLLFWVITGAISLLGVGLSVLYAPMDPSMGYIQKIIHLHLPTAVATLLASTVVFMSSVAYIWQRKFMWDDLADAAARVTAAYCTAVLVTGMIWGHSAWGRWWIWSPRLTFSLLLWLLYVSYLVIRPMIACPQRRAMVCAIYAIVAFLDVPLVYLSVMLIPDVHPVSAQLDPAARHTVVFWFAPVTLFGAAMIWTQFRHNVAHRLAAGTAAPPTRPPIWPSAAGPRL